MTYRDMFKRCFDDNAPLRATLPGFTNEIQGVFPEEDPDCRVRLSPASSRNRTG